MDACNPTLFFYNSSTLPRTALLASEIPNLKKKEPLCGFLADLDKTETLQLNEEESTLLGDREELFAADWKQMVRLWEITAVLGAISLGTILSLGTVVKKLENPLVVNNLMLHKFCKAALSPLTYVAFTSTVTAVGSAFFAFCYGYSNGVFRLDELKNLDLELSNKRFKRLGAKVLAIKQQIIKSNNIEEKSQLITVEYFFANTHVYSGAFH